MKILLVGEIYSANLGDGIIAECVSHFVKCKFRNAEISYLDMSGRTFFDTEYTTYSIYGKLQKKVLSLTKHFISQEILSGLQNFVGKTKYWADIEYKSYDIVVFVGGCLFHDYFVFPLTKIIKSCERNNVPVIFHAIGSKCIKSKWLVNKLQTVLASSCIKYISVRDNYEIARQFTSKNKKVDIVETFDTALNANVVYPCRSGNNTNRISVGLGVMKVAGVEDNTLINFWIGIIKCLEEKKISWGMFCNGSNGDFRLAVLIIKTLQYEYKRYLLPRPIFPQQLVENITHFDRLITFRLHSAIVATAFRIPCVCVSWDNKVDCFFQKIGKKEMVIRLENAKPTEIIEKLNQQNFDENLLETQANESIADLISSIENIKL